MRLARLTHTLATDASHTRAHFALAGARLLHDAGSSAVFQELAVLSGSPAGADIVRAGGGYI